MASGPSAHHHSGSGSSHPESGSHPEARRLYTYRSQSLWLSRCSRRRHRTIRIFLQESSRLVVDSTRNVRSDPPTGDNVSPPQLGTAPPSNEGDELGPTVEISTRDSPYN